MYSEVHLHRVFYKNRPSAGHRFRNVAVVEKEQFEVRIFEGDVVQTDPKFIANTSAEKVYFYPTLKSALDDAEQRSKESVSTGWFPHNFSLS
jgi:hypothetical protein